jgi:hypothetical protein
MNVARTFWEKATAAHVYCAQGRIRGERYARHWHDLAAIARSRYGDEAISNRAVAAAVANHKAFFFLEKDADGDVIDYKSAVTGNLRIVPEGAARNALQDLISNDAQPGTPTGLYCTEIQFFCREVRHADEPNPVSSRTVHARVSPALRNRAVLRGGFGEGTLACGVSVSAL